jgi:hypothetical protein
MDPPADNASGSHPLTLRTDAGMCALWNPKCFATIVDYDTWEDALLDDQDLLRHVQHGDLVPINLGGDGTWGLTVRIGPPNQAVLTERERRWLVVSSDPYLYVSDGELCVSGLEHISADPDPDDRLRTTTRIGLPSGRYQVTVHLLDWDKEPGATDAAGQPTAQALPDFVVLVSPEPTTRPSYRMRLETFDRPG